jgi:hypothetical protein
LAFAVCSVHYYAFWTTVGSCQFYGFLQAVLHHGSCTWCGSTVLLAVSWLLQFLQFTVDKCYAWFIVLPRLLVLLQTNKQFYRMQFPTTVLQLNIFATVTAVHSSPPVLVHGYHWFAAATPFTAVGSHFTTTTVR